MPTRKLADIAYAVHLRSPRRTPATPASHEEGSDKAARKPGGGTDEAAERALIDKPGQEQATVRSPPPDKKQGKHAAEAEETAADLEEEEGAKKPGGGTDVAAAVTDKPGQEDDRNMQEQATKQGDHGAEAASTQDEETAEVEEGAKKPPARNDAFQWTTNGMCSRHRYVVEGRRTGEQWGVQLSEPEHHDIVFINSVADKSIASFMGVRKNDVIAAPARPLCPGSSLYEDCVGAIKSGPFMVEVLRKWDGVSDVIHRFVIQRRGRLGIFVENGSVSRVDPNSIADYYGLLVGDNIRNLKEQFQGGDIFCDNPPMVIEVSRKAASKPRFNEEWGRGCNHPFRLSFALLPKTKDDVMEGTIDLTYDDNVGAAILDQEIFGDYPPPPGAASTKKVYSFGQWVQEPPGSSIWSHPDHDRSYNISDFQDKYELETISNTVAGILVDDPGLDHNLRRQLELYRMLLDRGLISPKGTTPYEIEAQNEKFKTNPAAGGAAVSAAQNDFGWAKLSGRSVKNLTME